MSVLQSVMTGGGIAEGLDHATQSVMTGGGIAEGLDHATHS